MRKILLAGLAGVTLLMMAGSAAAQKDAEGPTSTLSFVVLKEDNGKPVRNAAVIMHPVSSQGKQRHGGLELKTDTEGKTSLEGIPYGKLRVQVLASGFQTYGEDFEVDQPAMDFTIKLKRPKGQYSIYDQPSKDASPPKDANPPKSGDAPPPDKDNHSDKPN